VASNARRGHGLCSDRQYAVTREYQASLAALRLRNVSLYIRSVSIYNRIAVLRAERGLSRAQLAETVGVNPQTIGFLERGDYTPSLELAFKISRFFRLPIEAVFSPDPLRPLSEQVYPLKRKEA
jgi:putative transcriptional regulator